MAPAARAPEPQASARRAYLIDSGIASTAAAAFMIRDGDMFGQNITILENSGTIDGSLDGAGSPEAGYVLRGGQMLQSKYICTFALLDSIPPLDESQTVTQETPSWNATMRTSSKSRLFRDGSMDVAPTMGSKRDRALHDLAA